MRTTARALALLAAAGTVLAAAGCSSGSNSSGTSDAAASSSAKASGKAQVLYAGSLVNLMEKHIGPAFSSATGYGYSGVGEGSSQIANEIKGKVRRGDVFISASPKTNADLEGSANGDNVSWYTEFASAPLMLAYNPKSRFAADLRSKPWYQVVTESGFRLGHTDPKLDPKGKLSVQAEQEAQTQTGQSGLAARIEKNSSVFPEETLIGRLESGQLDAGFFYANEATEQKLPTVGLGGVKLAAHYTVTVLDKAQNPAAGAAFVGYLLGANGSAALRADGLTVETPKLSGSPSAVPAALRKTVGG
ncbi:substrate-binding domain-containing protein [Phaeacidiphilus oryzae]|jgi:molybdate/tungstate transport system substrate-binding protein|uniref:substrate-binding domain-containing protein n=1 Tax=Phaeacidiphilus oryzae TaxID=348818 RepID=UPI00055D6CA3|nr:substrate-binding domain-containing protein [Phaeacidiphilus oryzae]